MRVKKAIKCFFTPFYINAPTCWVSASTVVSQYTIDIVYSIHFVFLVYIRYLQPISHGILHYVFTLKKHYTKTPMNVSKTMKRPTITFVIPVSLTHRLIQFASDMKYSYRLN